MGQMQCIGGVGGLMPATAARPEHGKRPRAAGVPGPALAVQARCAPAMRRQVGKAGGAGEDWRAPARPHGRQSRQSRRSVCAGSLQG